MAELYYMPTVLDADETVVDGVRFAAYEPVHLDDQLKRDLIVKLRRNPWFAVKPDEARKEKWVKAREAQAQAREHRQLADKLEEDAQRSTS